MKKHEFLLKKQAADAANFSPPAEGENYMVFGQRKECIKPTLLNQQREKLGWNPNLGSIFNQCQTKRPRY